MEKSLAEIRKLRKIIQHMPVVNHEDSLPFMLKKWGGELVADVEFKESVDLTKLWVEFLNKPNSVRLSGREIKALSFNHNISTTKEFLALLKVQSNLSVKIFRGLIISLQKKYGSKLEAKSDIHHVFSRMERKDQQRPPFCYWEELLNNSLETKLSNEITKRDCEINQFFTEKRLALDSVLTQSTLLEVAKSLAESRTKSDEELWERFHSYLLLKMGDKKHLDSLLNIIIPHIFSGQSEASKNALLQYLLTHQYYGDPRLNSSKWVGIENHAKNLVLSILSAEDVKFFFDMICKGQDKHGRRKFWLKYTKSMTRSYVFISKKHYRDNQAILDREKSKNGRVFGSIDRGEISSFVMDFGNYIVVEFNHEGNACYLYRKRDFPEVLSDFYAKSITTEKDLKRLEFTDGHGYSGSGRWQTHQLGWDYELANFLSRNGIRAN